MQIKRPVNLFGIVVPTFIFIFILLIPFFIFVYLDSQVDHRNYNNNYYGEGSAPAPTEDWSKDPESPQYIMITRLALLSLVVAFGAIGSLISLLTRNQKSIERLKNFSISHLFIIQCVGAVFALLLMLFFWGGLVKGSLFPEISLGSYITMYSETNLGKLLVWSFIAGFSERLMPQLIENILQKVAVRNGANDKETPAAAPVEHG